MADGTLDVKGVRVACEISPSDEKRIAREMSPAGAWKARPSSAP